MGELSPYGKWIKKKRAELIESFGGKCMIKKCGETNELEFAHIIPTELNGRSRGSYARWKDVIENPFSYVLLCHAHHHLMDSGDEGIIRRVEKMII